MDFFSVIGVSNQIDEVEEDALHIPITLQKPALPATKILDTPHYSCLGLPITLANRRAIDHEYGYYDNGVFKRIDFARIEYTGRMVFNKPTVSDQSIVLQSKYSGEPWFSIEYIDGLIEADQQPMPEIPTLVASWVSSDPPEAYMKHVGHHYYGDKRKWFVRSGDQWVHIFAPGHTKLKMGWYKFEFKYSL